VAHQFSHHRTCAAFAKNFAVGAGLVTVAGVVALSAVILIFREINQF